MQAGNFAVGFEQFWVGPAGAGQWANSAFASLWMYNGDFTDQLKPLNQLRLPKPDSAENVRLPDGGLKVRRGGRC